MAKIEWGLKRTCQGCSARFYDLQRDPIVCPVCGTVYDPEKQPRVRRGSSIVRDEPVPVPTIVSKGGAAGDLDPDLIEDDADEVELDEIKDADDAADDELASEDSELMEDTSELGEDDDDIGEVMEHVDDELGDKS